jgi:dTDP-glucose pyrophosphorylase
VIANIIDRRKRRYRWRKITAIVEATYHDNICADSDQAEDDANAVTYDQREEISLAKAVIWAQAFPSAVTLYLYDLGDGIASKPSSETQHFKAITDDRDLD